MENKSKSSQSVPGFLTFEQAHQLFQRTESRRVGQDGVFREKKQEQLKALIRKRKLESWGPWLLDRALNVCHSLGREIEWLKVAAETGIGAHLLVIYFKSQDCSHCQKFSCLWNFWTTYWTQYQQQKHTKHGSLLL